MEDPVSCVINAAICAVREAFSPESPLPPVGGGTSKVRVFAGDAAPLAAWDAHREDCECGEPFLWVRLMRRYRTHSFPTPYVGPDPCPKPIVAAIEIGVGRCAAMSMEGCDWTAYESEAEISLDDSWRVELALCRVIARLKKDGCSDTVATDAVIPYGPEGGVVAWIGTFYAQV